MNHRRLWASARFGGFVAASIVLICAAIGFPIALFFQAAYPVMEAPPKGKEDLLRRLLEESKGTLPPGFPRPLSRDEIEKIVTREVRQLVAGGQKNEKL